MKMMMLMMMMRMMMLIDLVIKKVESMHAEMRAVTRRRQEHSAQ